MLSARSGIARSRQTGPGKRDADHVRQRPHPRHPAAVCTVEGFAELLHYNPRSTGGSVAELRSRALELAHTAGVRLQVDRALEGLGRTAMKAAEAAQGVDYLHQALTLYEEIAVPEATAIKATLRSWPARSLAFSRSQSQLRPRPRRGASVGHPSADRCPGRTCSKQADVQQVWHHRCLAIRRRGWLAGRALAAPSAPAGLSAGRRSPRGRRSSPAACRVAASPCPGATGPRCCVTPAGPCPGRSTHWCRRCTRRRCS